MVATFLLLKVLYGSLSIYPSGTGDINGIIRTFQNIDVGVIASSTYQTTNMHSPISKNPTSHWGSENIENSSYTIYFPYHYVQVTNYTIQSGNWPPGSHFPKNWLMQGSNNGFVWYIIDTCYNSGINYPLALITRECYCNYYQFFKFTHIGTNYASQYYFCIYQIDLFGIIENYTQKSLFSLVSCRSNIEFVDFSYLLPIFLIILSIFDSF